MGKYDSLHDHLAASHQTVLKLSFSEIEQILGDSLPSSARKHQAWWANETPRRNHVEATAWLEAGYRTRNLDLNAQTVEFVR